VDDEGVTTVVEDEDFPREAFANLLTDLGAGCGGILEFSPEKAGLDVTPANLDFSDCRQQENSPKKSSNGVSRIAGELNDNNNNNSSLPSPENRYCSPAWECDIDCGYNTSSCWGVRRFKYRKAQSIFFLILHYAHTRLFN